jgi:hypothetical protein
MMPTGGDHHEKGFIRGISPPQPLKSGFVGTVEMCSGLCELQSDVFFSIGHSFPAVAFVV